jgi:hypothetical protein
MVSQQRKHRKTRSVDKKTGFRYTEISAYIVSGKNLVFQGFSMVEESEKRAKLLHTVSEDMKHWLESEKKRTGRSVSFMVEVALKQWRDRIERGRKND